MTKSLKKIAEDIHALENELRGLCFTSALNCQEAAFIKMIIPYHNVLGDTIGIINDLCEFLGQKNLNQEPDDYVTVSRKEYEHLKYMEGMLSDVRFKIETKEKQ